LKKLDLGQTITILANVGVVAGIIFLAFELQQNNDQLQSQTRANLYRMQAEIQRDIFTNVGGVTDLLVKAQGGQQLTAVELNRLAAFRGYVLRTIEFMFREDSEGSRESADWMVIAFVSIPGFREFWEQTKISRDPDFVSFIEDNVVSQLDP